VDSLASVAMHFYASFCDVLARNARNDEKDDYEGFEESEFIRYCNVNTAIVAEFR